MDREIVQLEDNDDVDDGPQQQQDPAANVRVGESGDQEPAQQADLMGHAGTEDRAEADNAVFEAANWKGQSDPAAIGAAAPGRPAFAFPDDGSSQPKLPPPPDKSMTLAFWIPQKKAFTAAPFTAEQQALFQRWQESMRKERRRKAATEAARRRREASKSTGTTGSSTSLNQPQQQHQGRGKKATPAAGKNSALKRSDLIKLLQGVAARKRRHPSPGKGGAKRKQEAGEDDHGNEDELDWKELGFGPEELAALEGEGEDEEVEDSEDPDDDEVVDLGEDEADYRRRREQRLDKCLGKHEALLRRAELLKQPRQGIFVHMCGDCKARQKKAASFLYAPTNAENMSMLCIELCGECLERNILLAVSYKRAWVDNKVAVPQDLAHPLFIDRGPESTGSEDKRLMSFKFGWMLHQCAACQTYQKALAKDVFLQKKEADCFELTFMVCSMCCLANRDLQTSINRNFSGFADQRK